MFRRWPRTELIERGIAESEIYATLGRIDHQKLEGDLIPRRRNAKKWKVRGQTSLGRLAPFTDLRWLIQAGGGQ